MYVNYTHIEFGYFSLVSFNLNISSVFPCLSWPWHFQQEYIQISYFVDYPSIAFFQCVLMIRFSHAFWAGILQKCFWERGVCLYHCWWWDFGYLSWYVPNFSTVKCHAVIPTVVVLRWWFFRFHHSIYISHLEFCKEEFFFVSFFPSIWAHSTSKCLINFIRHYLAFVWHTNIYGLTLMFIKGIT